jgi:hypothetical protein
MAMNQRMKLKELADKFGRQPAYTFSSNGADHLLEFQAVVKVHDATGALRYSGECGARFPTKKEAQEAAAAAALRNGDVVSGGNTAVSSETRKSAWLGDAAFELILALLGTRHGLSVEQLDGVSQALFSNESLASYAPEQLASSTLTATSVESNMGVHLVQHVDALLDVLVPAMTTANPALAAALDVAVRNSVAKL